MKDALVLFKYREVVKFGLLKNNNAFKKVKAWDEDKFEMTDEEIKVRFI